MRVVKEVQLLFDTEGRTLYWHDPSESNGGWIPDSQVLWDKMWEYRHCLGGMAHTHPGWGKARPSMTDVTTYAALELGLGKQLLWPVVTFSDVIYVVRNPLYHAGEHMWTKAGPLTIEIEGIDELRRKSGSEHCPRP